jgi:hypothetical protein
VAKYIDNAEFLAAIKEYKKAIAEAKEKGLEKPRIPNFLGECIMKIAQGLSYKPNFINYTYKDASRTVSTILITSIQRNQVIHLLISLRLSTMHSCVESRKKRNILTSRVR